MAITMKLDTKTLTDFIIPSVTDLFIFPVPQRRPDKAFLVYQPDAALDLILG